MNIFLSLFLFTFRVYLPFGYLHVAKLWPDFYITEDSTHTHVRAHSPLRWATNSLVSVHIWCARHRHVALRTRLDQVTCKRKKMYDKFRDGSFVTMYVCVFLCRSFPSIRIHCWRHVMTNAASFIEPQILHRQVANVFAMLINIGSHAIWQKILIDRFSYCFLVNVILV